MAAPLDPNLRDAFQATAYELHLEGQILSLRIGAANPDLDALLTTHGFSSVTCISAHNPDAKAALPADNAAALQRLWSLIDHRGWRAVRHVGRPDSPDWLPEEGAAIFDFPLSDAEALAQQWRQVAFVTYRRGERLTLVITEIQRSLD